ncbi:MAG: ATP-binding protein, partial [Gammaproteobacteria bacterium]
MSTQSELFDLSRPDNRAGFRLGRFELLNWGTFDRHIWSIEPGGENALLTGDIGSGKSTLVDALTTLLLPAQKITYNKAAGAEGRERSLTSYVRGYYKSEKDAENLAAKAVALRDQNSYSVLLARFDNEGYAQCVTLAQVFWCKEGQNQPERFYVVAFRALSIATDFGDFGADILALKKRLRGGDRILVFDSFAQYAGEFRRRLGIQNEQAMELFYQTVSMKSVGNLTDFVRNHMLEEPPIQDRIQAICREFDNLNRAHEAVLKAKAQIGQLEPLVDNCVRYREIEERIREGLRCREALHGFFAHQKSVLLEQRIERRALDLAKHNDRLLQQRQKIDNLRQRQSDLRHSIDEHGGRRLADIAREIERLQREKTRKSDLAERYRKFCEGLGFPVASDSEVFHANRQSAEIRQAEIATAKQKLEEQKIDASIEIRSLKEQDESLEKELASLRGRESNIPLQSLEIRTRLCETLGLSEPDLPFIGELLQVHEDEREWEGAIERLLHNFGLSLLVPEDHYPQVARYVDKTHLRGRLVYFRVREAERGRFQQPAADTLARKIAIRPDSLFYGWLEWELAKRFDYVCCERIEDFQRHPKAVTRQGQIKTGGERHEKDDRHRLDDRARYVLGWSNRSKIEALEIEQAALRSRGEACLLRLTDLISRLNGLESSRDGVRDLLQIEHFDDIHWQPIVLAIQQYEEERRRIEQDSDILRTLQEQLGETDRQLIDAEKVREKSLQDQRSLEDRIENDRKLLAEALEKLAGLDQETRSFAFPLLAAMQPEALPGKTITVENCDANQSEMRDWLQYRIDAETAKRNRLIEKIIGQMQSYRNEFPLESKEVDASLDSAAEFAEMLKKLKTEDLPRHEQRFKQMLNEGTIKDIALLQNLLDKERQDIADKIDRINRSLEVIDYNPGSYIKLVSDKTSDTEIREFREDLRACLGDTLAATDDTLYNEHKFLEVKKLIDRFNGREGFSDLDKKWTRKVTDVRNWFLFSASERWREDHSEKEHYSDSAGKSGGQKEKLAYTILASALAYQFGLEWGETRSRSFRFVMIDEAFGRGSDDSARYGLELFKKLNLQLLIVTPLQKIHVIEDYIRSVHFVHNPDGSNSL